MRLNSVTSVRILKSLKYGMEVFILTVTYDNGTVDISSHMSSNGAFSKLKKMCPWLDTKFFKVEE